MYSIEEITCDIVWTFRPPPQSSGGPEVIRRPESCTPSLGPCTLANDLPVSDRNALSVPVLFRS